MYTKCYIYIYMQQRISLVPRFPLARNYFLTFELALARAGSRLVMRLAELH